MEKKVKTYKKWGIYLDSETGILNLYTPVEMEQPHGSRYPEMEVSTIEHAKEFIDNY